MRNLGLKQKVAGTVAAPLEGPGSEDHVTLDFYQNNNSLNNE